MKTDAFKQCLERIRGITSRLARPVRIMEVCGTHTVTACKSGLKRLLPENLFLLSGPGCPVCVTPPQYIDHAIELSRRPGVVIATFGDLLRVPGVLGTLELEKARGAQVNVVYSPLDALNLAEKKRDVTVVFLAVGFETTAPGIAWVVRKALEKSIANFTLLNALKTMPSALDALFAGGGPRIDGLICPGHVSSIIGMRPYEPICRRHKLPCVIAGFEPFDMIIAIEMLLQQAAGGKAEVQNEYRRSVSKDGNPSAKLIVREIFDETDAEWRGLGIVPKSGLRLKNKYHACDAAMRFPAIKPAAGPVRPGCRCGEVLCGRIAPPECPLYGNGCTPSTPVGACMVSSEGACAAYFKYCRNSGIAKKELLSQSAQSSQSNLSLCPL